MDLDRQIQTLVEQAPQDGTTPNAIQAIAPVLKSLAGQLRQLQYYILQTKTQQWVMTTLSHRAQPTREKRVIYAFPTVEDAIANVGAAQGDRVMPVAIPVAYLLFQMVALKSIDSVVFFETPGDRTNGTEVTRQSVEYLIQQYLHSYQRNSRLPPDIA